MSYAKLLHQLAQVEREIDLQHDPSWDDISRGPEVASERRPAIGAERSPAIGAERSPAIGAERSPAIGAERRPAIGSPRGPASDSGPVTAIVRIHRRALASARRPRTSGSARAAPEEMVPVDSIERDRVLTDAFLPLDEAAYSRITDSAMAAIGLQSPPPPARTPPRRHHTSAMLVAAAVISVAAVDAGLVLRGGEPQPVAEGHALAPLAAPYQLEATGGEVPQAVRTAALSAEPGGKQPTVLGQGASFGLVLRPERPHDHPVSVLACSARDGGAARRARPWAAAWERSAQGSFRVEGTRETLFPAEPAGEITLTFAVGDPASLPSCEAILGDAPVAGYALLTHRITLARD